MKSGEEEGGRKKGKVLPNLSSANIESRPAYVSTALAAAAKPPPNWLARSSLPSLGVVGTGEFCPDCGETADIIRNTFNN